MNVPLIDVQAHRQAIGGEIDRNIKTVVDHGKWIMGPEVAELELALEEWVGVDEVQVISCSNGTDALVLAAQALGLPPGAGVIVPSFTFIATAEAVAVLGGVPVFADVDPVSFNLDATSVEKAIVAANESGTDVVGIIAVDLFGQPADYAGLRAVADQNECWLVADAAQSFGASQNGVRVGALADVTTTSFFPAKPLGCYGDGGAVFTGISEVADTMRSLRVHGKGTHKYDNVRIGQNSRLDTIQASILLPKLSIFADELARRQEISENYADKLSGLLTCPELAATSTSAWAQYTISVASRDALKLNLDNDGIGSAIYYPTPLHMQTAYVPYHVGGIDLPVSEALSSSVLSLPMYPYLSSGDQDNVIRSVIRFLESSQG